MLTEHEDGNVTVCAGDNCYTTQHFHICGSSTVAAKAADDSEKLLFVVLEDALLAQESAVVCEFKTSGERQPCNAAAHMSTLSAAIKAVAPSAPTAHHEMHIAAADKLSGGAPSLKMEPEVIGCKRFWSGM